MKATKKCELVPYEKYMRLTQNTSTTPQEPSLSHDTLDAWNEKKEKHVETDIDDDKADVNTNRLITNALDDNVILGSIPTTLRSKATLLLNYLHKQGVITWNGEGNILVHDKIIEHTHIADLVKDALATHKHFMPAEADTFYRNLRNILLSLIRNPERRQIIQESRGTNYAPVPPPGLPDKKPRISLLKVKDNTFSKTKKLKATKRKMNTWKTQWKSLP